MFLSAMAITSGDPLSLYFRDKKNNNKIDFIIQYASHIFALKFISIRFSSFMVQYGIATHKNDSNVHISI